MVRSISRLLKKVRNASRTPCFDKLSRTENHQRFEILSVRPEPTSKDSEIVFSNLVRLEASQRGHHLGGEKLDRPHHIFLEHRAEIEFTENRVKYPFFGRGLDLLDDS